MSQINLPDAETVIKTATTYGRDLAERTLSTAVVAAGGVAVASGPGDMFHASFWETMAAAGIAAGGTLLKGMLARAFGSKNSASLARGV